MKLLRKQISVCIFWFSLSCKDVVDFHCTVMRPVLEYRSSIFHHSLPDCLSERVQKRALSIIAPDKSYKHCLVSFGLSTLYDRRNDQCIKLFIIVYPRISTNSLACFLRTTKATTIPDRREFMTCPAFAQTKNIFAIYWAGEKFRNDIKCIDRGFARPKEARY